MLCMAICLLLLCLCVAVACLYRRSMRFCRDAVPAVMRCDGDEEVYLNTGDILLVPDIGGVRMQLILSFGGGVSHVALCVRNAKDGTLCVLDANRNRTGGIPFNKWIRIWRRRPRRGDAIFVRKAVHVGPRLWCRLQDTLREATTAHYLCTRWQWCAPPVSMCLQVLLESHTTGVLQQRRGMQGHCGTFVATLLGLQRRNGVWPGHFTTGARFQHNLATSEYMLSDHMHVLVIPRIS